MTRFRVITAAVATLAVVAVAGAGPVSAAVRSTGVSDRAGGFWEGTDSHPVTITGSAPYPRRPSAGRTAAISG